MAFGHGLGQESGEVEFDLAFHHARDLQRPGSGVDQGNPQGGIDPVEVLVRRHERPEAVQPDLGACGYGRRGRGGRREGQPAAHIADDGGRSPQGGGEHTGDAGTRGSAAECQQETAPCQCGFAGGTFGRHRRSRGRGRGLRPRNRGFRSRNISPAPRQQFSDEPPQQRDPHKGHEHRHRDGVGRGVGPARVRPRGPQRRTQR